MVSLTSEQAGRRSGDSFMMVLAGGLFVGRRSIDIDRHEAYVIRFAQAAAAAATAPKAILCVRAPL